MKENNNGNDTNVGSMENSIEEDIKNAKHFINSIKTDKEYKEENGWHGYYNKEIVELARILEHILSDYKKLKEEFKAVDYECRRLEQKEVEQEKIIDLMAKFIEDDFTVDKFCTKKGCYADNYINGHCEKCLNCIKQYFINKAKEVK